MPKKRAKNIRTIERQREAEREVLRSALKVGKLFEKIGSGAATYPEAIDLLAKCGTYFKLTQKRKYIQET